MEQHSGTRIRPNTQVAAAIGSPKTFKTNEKRRNTSDRQESMSKEDRNRGSHDEPHAKRPSEKRRKLHGFDWRLYPPIAGFVFSQGDKVMVKSKDNETRRGIVSSVCSGAAWEIKVAIDDKKNEPPVSCKDHRRVTPLFEKPTIAVTAETNYFRSMVLQTNNCDNALEIGCSTGETSKLLIANKVRSWIGFDTSDEMVDKCQNLACSENHHVAKINALIDPKKAAKVARKFASNLTVIFVDIGGNRELINVFRMVSWILESFHPRLIVVKSRELVQSLKSSAVIDSHTGMITSGDEWFQRHKTKRAIPKHPLRAPLTLSPKDGTTPICRYHNYHKQGCIKKDCPFDHEYCHLCQEHGHIALLCPTLP